MTVLPPRPIISSTDCVRSAYGGVVVVALPGEPRMLVCCITRRCRGEDAGERPPYVRPGDRGTGDRGPGRNVSSGWRVYLSRGW